MVGQPIPFISGSVHRRPFSYSFSYEMVDTSTNDAEPNDVFDEAITIEHKQTKAGHIGYLYNGTGDQYDYYRTVLPVDGTLKVYVKATNSSGGTGYLYMYGYDRRKSSYTIGDFIQKSNVAAGEVIIDTLTAYGRAADTFYFRLSSTQAFSYSFSYEMVDTSTNDAEPNDSFSDATPIAHKETKYGHTNYLSNGTADPYDYYRTLLPSRGTLIVYVNGINRGSGTGYLYLYGYDYRKSSASISGFVDISNVAAGAAVSDTFLLPCVIANSFFFRLNSTQAFAYDIRYEVTLGADTTVKSCPGT